MTDLLRWLWWQARRVDWFIVCMTLFWIGVAWGGYWVVQHRAERQPYRCDVVQRAIAAHEACVLRDGCIYQQADVQDYYRNLSLKETYCQGVTLGNGSEGMTTDNMETPRG